MKTKTNNILALLIIAITIYSCDDILEDNISDDIISIISPQENDVIQGNTVQFLWNTIEGADNYTVQVYRSSTLVIDSTVTTSPLNLILNSDIYEWRIKGENSAYQTQFSFPISFEVETSLDLTNQTVLLNNPSDNLYTNDTSFIFTWADIESSDSYSFELVKVSATGNSTVHLQDEILTTSYLLDSSIINEDAEYQWMIKAVNETSETLFSTRTFFIDTVSPSVPSLFTPAFEEEFIIDDTVTFSWGFGTDTGAIESIITSVYEIASDDSFITIIESGSSIITNFNFTFDTSGTYYWRVRGEDEAGNVGTYNLNGKLIVNE